MQWNLVPNCGQVLRNTNLIPIKTPIRNEYIIKARKASQRLLREQSEEELQYFGLQAFCEQSAEFVTFLQHHFSIITRV